MHYNRSWKTQLQFSFFKFLCICTIFFKFAITVLMNELQIYNNSPPIIFHSFHLNVKYNIFLNRQNFHSRLYASVSIYGICFSVDYTPLVGIPLFLCIVMPINFLKSHKVKAVIQKVAIGESKSVCNVETYQLN